MRFKKGQPFYSEYATWAAMRNRCNNPNDKRYHRYGGRGIKVDPSWNSFDKFYEDMGPRPSPKHSIDRINNDGPYCKENCRWATIKEQNNNRSAKSYFHPNARLARWGKLNKAV